MPDGQSRVFGLAWPRGDELARPLPMHLVLLVLLGEHVVSLSLPLLTHVHHVHVLHAATESNGEAQCVP